MDWQKSFRILKFNEKQIFFLFGKNSENTLPMDFMSFVIILMMPHRQF